MAEVVAVRRHRRLEGLHRRCLDILRLRPYNSRPDGRMISCELTDRGLKIPQRYLNRCLQRRRPMFHRDHYIECHPSRVSGKCNVSSGSTIRLKSAI